MSLPSRIRLPPSTKRPLPLHPQHRHNSPSSKSKEMEVAEGCPTPESALGRSTMLNWEGIDKVLPTVAVDTSEWGPTKILPSWTPLTELAASSVTLHLSAIFSGLLPPFSEFFNAILTHYQIHALHLDPRSVLLLSLFSFLYEAFLGVLPSVALFRNFLSLRLTAPDQHSRCASFQAMDTMEGECIDMRIDHTTEGFRRKWVYVDTSSTTPAIDPIIPGGIELWVGAHEA
ncbi:hypothetical protein D1007_55852 [Hordeum vulgare]|nr:hypothetical protein D1007_55852 [Hordeum vulgare]